MIDTLKDYIMQCEKAKEIQKLLDKSECGNMLCFTLNYGVSRPQETRILLSGHEVYWLEKYGNGKKCQEWVSDYWESDHPVWHGKDTVWLPTQDQLQKMILLKYKKGFRRNNTYEGYPISFVEDFTQFVRCCVAQNYNSVKWSMEQLWLAFVMKEKYDKIWNGEDWIKEK